MITIDRGEKKIFEIDFRLKTGRPFDLTGFDRFKVCLPIGSGSKVELTDVANANGSIVEILGNAILGILKVTVGPDDTLKLVADQRLYIDVEIDKSATPGPIRERFLDALNVTESVCSN